MIVQRIHAHFSEIASRYENLRTTDSEPVLFIRRKLQGLSKIEAADVGCGVGRYCLKLFDYLGGKLHLICIDYCREMLRHLVSNLKEKKITNFTVINASGDAFPLSNSQLDAVFCFNSVHHFTFLDFVREACRVLRDHGHLFVYTRLRSQNRTTIWGKFFPEFCERETRLFERSQLNSIIEKVPSLKLERTELFKYKRRTKLEWLITQARYHHYSTFCLYEEREFEEALKIFQQLVTRHFGDTDNIVWDDENIMLVIRKSAH